MIIPALVRTDFKEKQVVVEHLYNRLNNMLNTSRSTDKTNKDHMSNVLALKSIIAMFPDLNKISPAPDLYIDLIRKFILLNPKPSVRFVSELAWSLWKVNVTSVPPQICRYIENAVSNNIAEFKTRDLVSIIYCVGKVLRRKEAGEIKDVNFNLGPLMSLLLNELAIKKEFIDHRQKSMLQEVKKDLVKYVPLAKRVIN